MSKRLALSSIVILLVWTSQACVSGTENILREAGLSNSPPETTYEFPEPGSPPVIPLPWEPLGLTGRLILIRQKTTGDQLIEVDLSTGSTRSLFQAPERSWLAGAEVSPDGKWIVLAYAPPPPEGPQFGYTDLFVMPSDGSGEPVPFLERTYPDETFANPIWSPDGQFVYYTHLYRDDPESFAFNYRIEKASLDGQIEVIVDNAIWPSVSPDGTKLAFRSFDPAGGSVNELFVADADGFNPRRVIPTGVFPTVDAHLFSPHSDRIYFSAANSQTSAPQPWYEKLLGVDVAWAHNVPSDWHRVAVDGGRAQRLTRIGEIGLYGAFSPDGRHMAFIGQGGIYVMESDGKELTAMANTAVVGTIDWIR